METLSQETAIICYSRTGHSERIANALAERLGGTVILLDTPSYRGVLGFIRAATQSLMQRIPAQITPLQLGHRFASAVICGPVWTSYPAVPIRACLRLGKELPQTVGLFLTYGGSNAEEKTLDVAQQDFGRDFAAIAALKNTDEGTAAETRLLDTFCRQMAQATRASQSSQTRAS